MSKNSKASSVVGNVTQQSRQRVPQSRTIAAGLYLQICSLSCYNSQTVHASAKVTIESEYGVICDLSNVVICNDLEWIL